MSVEHVTKHHQAQGAFDFGRIRENKPIGFPHENGGVTSLSNLFYWAHAWSDVGGLIDTHPHQGFEIMSYVIDGQLSHYDTKYDRWLGLDAGDAQVIRSGKGISHAEKVLAGGRFFQIWFDPDLSKSLKKEASYTDIRSGEFPVEHLEYGIVKTIVGAGSPMYIDSEGVVVKDISNVSPGNYQIPLNVGSVYSIYILDGEGRLKNKAFVPADFFVLREESQLKLDVDSSARIFVIESPAKVSYTTYAESQLMTG